MITSDRAFSTLLGERPEFREKTKGSPILITISPSSKYFVKFKSSTMGEKGYISKPYGKLLQMKQYDYCLNIVEKVFKGYVDRLLGVCEFNKQGNVHFHFIIQSESIKDDIDLHEFRRMINNEHYIARHVDIDHDEKHFCHIVYCTDIDYIEEYLMKDNEKMISKGYKNYYF